ncbi:thaumatin family protein [Streptomyces sp. SID3212]|uniref:thaumatin family protein n=1 Tax=Streptomyces sp. SID3212 TaxID=2690259 RepID=UPI00136E7CD8|nr:thaumatin family protein [Streptomyces sp. SID3212]MYV52900.1 Thaumatin pathogenesis-related protein [Streptomyces sp. SID3212]
MARTRHRARRSRSGRGWWAGAAGVVAAGGAVAALMWPSLFGAAADVDSVRTAGVPEASATVVLPSVPAPTPSASPSPSASSKPKPKKTAAAKKDKQPTTRKSEAAASTPSTGGASAGTADTRIVSFVNNESQTVWVAALGSPEHPLAATGWKLTPGQRVAVEVPSGWIGRFWGRTGCSFDSAGNGHCETGDCAGGFQCTGSGATPATLAEFALSAPKPGAMDFYDVSMVDGSNLPMYINITRGDTTDPVSASGCSAGGCTKRVACPDKMRFTAGGRVVGCTNPCTAFGGKTYCCQDEWAGRENCVPSRWPVDYTQVFKRAEPYAYSYAFDDSATMPCKGACDYRVTFGVTT